MTAPLAVRLRPGLLTAWRSPGRLQLGVGASAHVLEGLTSADELVVDALGTGADVPSLEHLASLHGSPPGRTVALVEALAAIGALEEVPPSPAPAGQPGGGSLRGACVAVLGASPTGRAVALGLAAAGTGTVLVEDEAPVTRADVGPGAFGLTDLGLPRGVAAARAVARHHPSTTTQARELVRPDVVVLLASGAHDARTSEPLVREEVVHLGVLQLGASAVVGPLVRPGATACLRCLDLHRTDRDPEWPRLLPQLSAPAGGPRRPEPPVLVGLTAAVAVQQVVAHLLGHEPAALDATVEIDTAGGFGVRPWSAHPGCGCSWAGLEAA
ncbi:bacteriocin biosynthesis cyclodehydratase domain-containing protein [Quadrisphaera granulorum]|uniref:Bacteriocin biosynthesis cyclodehydratase domain-containing protein n=1 Tax=Quadrisphaera granulorum TaxID=317664 RepID=A0A316AAB0_9ACTN|nr:hypothetical protein [Quadrisphaera granulorum]PWJ54846.1 bacteriocin biosynthesis cyclodehydratase domain-containing protein [Quadrisphaera granulorum]SZE95792.1 bacteriocin biosynthesis cyclodehydratase domain-containing protein [Quadrisphaera granulorum]